MDHRWSQRLWWLLGGFLVCLGALAGAFGTVAWLTVLCAPSLPRMLLGVLSLGVAPVVGGGAVLWMGLSILETQAARARVHVLPEGHLVEAARGGATALMIAQRLGIGDVPEITRRLDDLVARDVLTLDVTEQGELIYQARRLS
ncbi:MAG: hypothetical protein QM820_52070 [Minicystis sp.]